jgi:hypothetical protein
MQLDFSPIAYGRADDGLPESRQINLYAEASAGTLAKVALRQRPGMVADYEVGTGPISGQFQANGVFSGDRFAVSGGELYRETTLLGAVLRGRRSKFAASDTQLVVISGGAAYCYDGAALAVIAIPNDNTVIDVVLIGARFYFLISETDQWFWSDLGDATTIDGLAFEYSDTSPDANVGAIAIGDEVAFLGRQSVEFWYLTGSATGPLQRAQGRKYSRGCAAQGSIAYIDNGFVFVGDDRVVYRAGSVPTRISTFGIDARLRACTIIDALTSAVMEIEGHAFYILNIPGEGSFAYDAASQGWAEWRSFGLDVFRGRSCISKDGVSYMGDDQSGVIWRLDASVFTDDGGPIERLASAAVATTKYGKSVSRLELYGAKGVGLEDGTEGLVEVRYSDDQGRTWTAWRSGSLGPIGGYEARTVWRRLGLIKPPGRLYEIRSTSSVMVGFSAMEMA